MGTKWFSEFSKMLIDADANHFRLARENILNLKCILLQKKPRENIMVLIGNFEF